MRICSLREHRLKHEWNQMVWSVNNLRCGTAAIQGRLHDSDSPLPSFLSLPLRTRPVERYTVDCLLKEKAMAQIAGRLIADLFPDCTVRMVFIAQSIGGNEAPITAKNPD